MANGRFVSYLRVSTARQGASGLGLEAQRKAVTDYLNGGRWTLVRELVECESGKKNDRPKLAEAMALCRLHGATLLVARLDRLSRDAAFLMTLQRAGIRFVAADLPDANELTVGIMAVVAQADRKRIAANTKAALAAAKARGTVMGGFRGYVPTAADVQAATEARQARADARAADLAPIIAELRAEGVTTLSGLAVALTARGIPTARGKDGATWSAVQVQRVMQRVAL